MINSVALSRRSEAVQDCGPLGIDAGGGQWRGERGMATGLRSVRERASRSSGDAEGVHRQGAGP